MATLVMCIDFEKCFDSIEHHAISGALEYFNFGKLYIEAVMLLMADFELCTTNNGEAS